MSGWTPWYSQRKILASGVLPNANPRRQVFCVAVEYRLYRLQIDASGSDSIVHPEFCSLSVGNCMPPPSTLRSEECLLQPGNGTEAAPSTCAGSAHRLGHHRPPLLPAAITDAGAQLGVSGARIDV